jgi:hypothetical protein
MGTCPEGIDGGIMAMCPGSPARVFASTSEGDVLTSIHPVPVDHQRLAGDHGNCLGRVNILVSRGSALFRTSPSSMPNRIEGRFHMQTVRDILR